MNGMLDKEIKIWYNTDKGTNSNHLNFLKIHGFVTWTTQYIVPRYILYILRNVSN